MLSLEKFTKFNKVNDVIVNCTSVGYLNHDKSLIPQKIIKSLKKKKLFYDIIHQPLETKLLALAKKINIM